MARRRAFAFICYPESCPDIQGTILSQNPREWAYILHDFDVTDTGELKKPHYHVYLYFDNARSSSLVEDFGIKESQLLYKKISVKSLVRYYLHIDNPDKTQYNVDQIVHCDSLNPDFYLDERECIRVKSLLGVMRDCYSQGMSFMAFVERCCDLGYYDILRRSQYMYIKCWDELSRH